MMNNTIVPDKSTKFLFQGNDGRQIDLCALWEGCDSELSRFRLNNYSFIFQSTNMMRNFTAYENVAYTRMLQGYSRKESFERTRRVLESLGMGHITEERMTQELSGGQQQRLAFARAVLPDYTVLFGDEPTGNLDPENATRVMRILSDRPDSQQGTSAIIVSHDMHLAITFADVIIKIRKVVGPKQSDDGEAVTYGLIDDSCVFRPNVARNQWSGGGISLSSADFENYLRKK